MDATARLARSPALHPERARRAWRTPEISSPAASLTCTRLASTCAVAVPSPEPAVVSGERHAVSAVNAGQQWYDGPTQYLPSERARRPGRSSAPACEGRTHPVDGWGRAPKSTRPTRVKWRPGSAASAFAASSASFCSILHNGKVVEEVVRGGGRGRRRLPCVGWVPGLRPTRFGVGGSAAVGPCSGRCVMLRNACRMAGHMGAPPRRLQGGLHAGNVRGSELT